MQFLLIYPRHHSDLVLVSQNAHHFIGPIFFQNHNVRLNLLDICDKDFYQVLLLVHL